jgi:ATP-binding cassette, subfamily F, member 3
MLALDNLSKFFGSRAIFDGVSWSMADDARVGLVGLNGAGKTTLLSMIAGVIEPDGGRIVRPQRTAVGYLAQDAPEIAGRPLLEETLTALAEMQALDRRRVELAELLEREHVGAAHDAALAELGDVLSELEHRGFYEAESRATAVLFGLGFREPDLARDVAEFSGGIRMRIALAKLLVSRPEFLMLDEPTNHLDLEARNWLEDYLASYPGGIIVVSHDRYFLDRVTTRTVEVAGGKLVEYQGSYSDYLVQREQRWAAELAAYEKQRTEIEHIEAFVSRFRYQASKAKLVQSRIKQLEKIERLPPPPGLDKPPAISFPQCERGARRVFELRGAAKRYGELTVYDGIDLVIERGARVALVGPNGAGKSTMMKLLAGVELLSGGDRTVGAGVEVGYFAQDLADSLDYSRSVLAELSGAAQGMTTGEIRGLLGAMLFSGDDALKRVGVLSGGERARLVLAKVLARRNNCLLLDEPTNNLDIVAKDTLLEALRRFSGTVVIVSHDRYMLNELAKEVIEVGQGHAIRYLGNYDNYLAKKAAIEAAGATPSSSASASATSSNGGAAAASTRSRGLRVVSGAQSAVGASNGAEPGKAVARNATTRKDEAAAREAEVRIRRQREHLARQRESLETEIGRKEGERAGLAEQMDDPNFYLARPDANDLIAAYERLGREIERLYEELLGLDNAAPANS